MGIVLKEGLDVIAGLFRKGSSLVLAAGEAHCVFEDAFGAFEDFGDGKRVVNFVKIAVAGEASLERSIVLQRMEKRRKVTHGKRMIGEADKSNVF